MARLLFALALCVVAASAFVSPVNNAVSTPAFVSTAKMVPVEMVDAASNFAQNANVIATSANEFGGYFYPVAGLGLIATLILYLSPPLADE